MNELLRRLLFLPDQASTASLRVDHLHYFVILVTFAASFFIFFASLYWLVRWRRRPGQTLTPRFEPPRWAKLFIIGGPLSLFLLWFGLGFRDYVWMRSPPAGAMDVYVTGKQWMWKFSYPDGPSAIETLTVPLGRPVRLLLTSRDVIHSFFVPAFRIKQDALPGRFTDAWFEARQTGRFQVLCAEFCGSGHSLMRAEVVVLPAAEYDAWLAAQRRGLASKQDSGATPARTASIVEQGRLAAERHECLKCHTVDGTAHIGPTWQDLYRKTERIADGSEVLADEGYLTESMMDPLAKVVAGYDAVMPTYQGQLTAPEAAAIVEYIKSLKTARLRPEPSPPPVFLPRPGSAAASPNTGPTQSPLPAAAQPSPRPLPAAGWGSSPGDGR
ncbi:MAG: cytochrome c oxidase subunit II [Myxococcales bacterium]